MKRMMNAAAGGHSTATECERKEWAPRPLLAYKLAAEPHKNLGTKKTCYVLLMFSHHQHVRRPKQY